MAGSKIELDSVGAASVASESTRFSGLGSGETVPPIKRGAGAGGSAAALFSGIGCCTRIEGLSSSTRAFTAHALSFALCAVAAAALAPSRSVCAAATRALMLSKKPSLFVVKAIALPLAVMFVKALC